MGVLCCFILATGSVSWIVEKCCTTFLINTGTTIMASFATMRGLHVAFYETQEPGPSIVVNLEHVGSLRHQEWQEDLRPHSNIGCLCQTAVLRPQSCLHPALESRRRPTSANVSPVFAGQDAAPCRSRTAGNLCSPT